MPSQHGLRYVDDLASPYSQINDTSTQRIISIMEAATYSYQGFRGFGDASLLAVSI